MLTETRDGEIDLVEGQLCQGKGENGKSVDRFSWLMADAVLACTIAVVQHLKRRKVVVNRYLLQNVIFIGITYIVYSPQFPYLRRAESNTH